MSMSELVEVRRDLEELRRRFSRGEMAEETYLRQRRLILEELPPEERREVSGSAPRAPQRSLRPSGLPTVLPSLTDLDLRPGTELLGQWRIVRQLGCGGFGAVFEAEELHLGQIQAVKVLDPAMTAQEKVLARFREEVSVMRELFYPHIVRVYDYREDLTQHLALISMEYIHGSSVQELLDLAKEGAPVGLRSALAILSQTLAALEAAHNSGIVHRDVKPGNLLLAGGSVEELLRNPAKDPDVRLVDFGIASHVERASMQSRVVGTPAYVAPELLTGTSARITPAADTYGAGAVAYELLTGRVPVGRFPVPSEICDQASPPIDDLVLGLLHSTPEDRPTTARARAAADQLLKSAVAPGEYKVHALRSGGSNSQRKTDDEPHTQRKQVQFAKAPLSQAEAESDKGAFEYNGHNRGEPFRLPVWPVAIGVVILLLAFGVLWIIESSGRCPTASLEPKSVTMSHLGASGHFEVTAPNCPQWAAVSDVGWLSITSVRTSSGEGSVSFHVAPNNSMKSRSAGIIMDGLGLTFFVVQDPGPSLPDASLSPPLTSLPAEWVGFL